MLKSDHEIGDTPSMITVCVNPDPIRYVIMINGDELCTVTSLDTTARLLARLAPFNRAELASQLHEASRHLDRLGDVLADLHPHETVSGVLAELTEGNRGRVLALLDAELPECCSYCGALATDVHRGFCPPDPGYLGRRTDYDPDALEDGPEDSDGYGNVASTRYERVGPQS